MITLCLEACDCGQIVKGTVLDRFTKQPIQGVRLERIYRTDQSKYFQNNHLSNSSGRFAVNYLAGGALFYCPDFQLGFFKLGYIAQKKTYNGIVVHDTVYLEKVK